MHTIGQWLKTNGEAIYNTRTTPIYNKENIWFTAGKDGKTLYAIYALPEGESLPTTIEWEGNTPTGRMTLLQGNRKVKYTSHGGKTTVVLPKGLKHEPIALRFTVKK